MEQLIKNDNYYTVKGFMFNELKLKGNELVIFAIVHTITKSGGVCWCSRNYLAEFSCSSIRSVQNSLNSLVKKGFIKKSVFQTKDGVKISYISTVNEDVQKLHTPSAKIAHPSAKTAPNKEEININNNINNKYNIPCAPIDLKSYLLKDLSSVSQDMFFTSMSILENENKIILAFNSKDYKYIMENEFYKISLERQMRFYNIQHKTQYELEIREKVAN